MLGDGASEEVKEETNVEDDFENEMQALKAPAKKRRFWGVEIGLDCCVFIKVSLNAALRSRMIRRQSWKCLSLTLYRMLCAI